MSREPNDVRAALDEAKLQGLRVTGAAEGLCATCKHGVLTVVEVQRGDDAGEAWKAPSVESYARCFAPRCAFHTVAWRVTACAAFESPVAE